MSDPYYRDVDPIRRPNRYRLLEYAAGGQVQYSDHRTLRAAKEYLSDHWKTDQVFSYRIVRAAPLPPIEALREHVARRVFVDGDDAVTL